MKWFVGFAVVVVALILGMVIPSQVFADVDEGMFAVSVQSLAGDTGWGGDLTVPLNTKHLTGHFTTHAQGGGSLIRGKYHVEFGRALGGGFEVFVYNDGTFKGPTLAGLGRRSALGTGGKVPPIQIGSWRIVGGFGVFGQNAGALAKKNAYDILESENFNLDELEAFEEVLSQIHPDKTGLSLDYEGNALHALVFVEGQRGRTSVKWSASPKVAGEGGHQSVISFKIARPIGNFNVAFGGDLAAQLIDGRIETELATRGSFEVPF